MKIKLSELIIDPEWKSFLQDKSLFIVGKGYVACKTDGGYTRLATLVLAQPIMGFEVDHINRDKLNNKKKNLRIVTKHANLLNHGKRSVNLINDHFRTKPYAVRLGHNKSLGWYSSYEEGAKVYDEAHKTFIVEELTKTRLLNLHLTDEEYYFYLCPTF
jgi:hypothetical protein